MTEPLVSVVIPCHNYGRFLGEAIQSSLAQTHSNVEVVVVDDGSHDDSSAVAARYPVRLISQENAGVCEAANRGIAASQGEFVLRLDADDVLAPTYVEETLRALKAHPDAHFAYTEFAYFGARSGTYRIEDFDAGSLAERNFIHATALMRRSSFDRAGGYRLDMTRVRCEEWDLWLSFADLEMHGVLVPMPLLYYRQHGSASRNASRFGLRGLRREIAMAARLQDHHPIVFAPARLLRRLATLPRRLTTGDVSAHHALLLTGFYGVMLLRAAVHEARPRR